MKFVRIDSVYLGKIELNRQTIDYLKKNRIRSVALYGAVQFNSRLQSVFKQLKELNIAYFSSQPARTDAQYQILGCDVFHDNFKLEKDPDVFLYIGDGKFHPRAILLAQKDRAPKDFRPVLIYNPPEDKMEVLGLEDVKKILKKYRIALMKFLQATNIGLVVTIKPGQQHMKSALLLEKAYPDKRFFYFVDNTILYSNFEHFPFIEVWVNTACPRMGLDDAAEFEGKVMLNVTDAQRASEVLAKDSVMNAV